MEFNVTDDNVTLHINDTNATLSAEVEIPTGLATDETQATIQVHEETPVRFTISESGGGGTSNYNDLTNKPSINGVELVGDKTTEDLGIEVEFITDLGNMDMSDYDYDFWLYLEDHTVSGNYKVHDTCDGFDYFFTVEAVGNQIYQEYWYTEESPLMRNCRRGVVYDDEIEWDNSTEWLTTDMGYDNFAPINHNHYIEETVNENNIWTYLNSFGINKTKGSYKITNTRNSAVYYVEYDYRIVASQYKIYQKVISTVDDEITVRVGTRPLGSSTITWGVWRTYLSEEQVEDMLSENYYTAEQVDDLLDGFAPNNMIPILWADLVELRDNGELTAGAYYRITDYNFVTTKANIQSGNHQFDVVVLAVSDNMVSETAYACRHAGDTYFEREITTGGIQWLYTLYVDYMGDNYGDEPTDHADDLHASDEFVDYDYLEHPDTGDTVPALYKTDIEEYDLDDPDYDDAYFYEGTYDFDGDEFDMWSKYEFNGRSWDFAYQYALTPIVVEDGELIVSPHQETKTVPVNLSAWELKYCLDNDKTLFDWAIPEGKGVIYYLKDEFGNEAGYDFKNVKFRRKRVASTGNSILNSFVGQYIAQDGYYQINTGSDSRFFYTFVGSDTTADGSLFGECNYTKISPYILDGKRTLNDVVLYWAINSFVDQNCYDCTFVSGFRNVSLGSSSNTLLISGCNSTTFKGTARNSTFVNLGNCEIGINFANNIGASTADCRFGAMCQNNNYGVSMSNNAFGDSCSSLTFGNYCYGNQFGHSVMNSTFGNYCSYNTFEGQNSNITFTNYCRYIVIELTCMGIKLNTSGGGTSQYLQYVKCCRGVKNITRQPTRNLTYETIFYKQGRTETAV